MKIYKIKRYKISEKLKEIKFNFTKNLGKHASTEPVKSMRKSKKLAEAIGILLGEVVNFIKALKPFKAHGVVGQPGP
ncbi:MAG: hypothetical protein CMH63_00525 [Nanoarchaeota archaeon]|nr:hypothetical protein [Nanoarchaeota archaeon]|tara:strand:+ start:10338 stop:10568 length:231 start_codon:yes stop_codon:yes gene_type:complete